MAIFIYLFYFETKQSRKMLRMYLFTYLLTDLTLLTRQLNGLKSLFHAEFSGTGMALNQN